MPFSHRVNIMSLCCSVFQFTQVIEYCKNHNPILKYCSPMNSPVRTAKMVFQQNNYFVTPIATVQGSCNSNPLASVSYSVWHSWLTLSYKTSEFSSEDQIYLRLETTEFIKKSKIITALYNEFSCVNCTSVNLSHAASQTGWPRLTEGSRYEDSINFNWLK